MLVITKRDLRLLGCWGTFDKKWSGIPDFQGPVCVSLCDGGNLWSSGGQRMTCDQDTLIAFFFLSLSFLVDLLRTLQTPPRRSDKSEINKVPENVFQKKSRHDDDKIKSNKCTSSSSSPLLLQYMLQHIHAVVKELLNPHHYSLAHVSAIIKTFWTKHFLQSELQVIMEAMISVKSWTTPLTPSCRSESRQCALKCCTFMAEKRGLLLWQQKIS